ncbi:MAG TPA: MXAN_5187 C-terminal domain-containing protein [Polyangiaceae bacterium]
METAELDVALEELETRLERLRALYEQYFMGIERVEPAIPRKDVDRRIYVLRREKIRNTAKRFKLQTIIQRYNTFQQYWQRICREIENGTYKRHLIRAERIAPDQLLTVAARKRLGRRVGRSEPPAEAEPGVDAPPLQVVTPGSSPPMPNLQHAPPSRTPAPKAALESLSLDMDFLGDWDPGKRVSKAPVPKVVSPVPMAASPEPAAPAAPVPAALPARAPLRPPPKPAKLPLPEPTPALTSAAKPIAEPVAVKPAPAPARSATAAAKTIADEQVRSLHARLVEAKRQTKESSSVSVEGLARSLEATAAKLREQHKNRKIEFDVVIKDGKAVVKPIVR